MFDRDFEKLLLKSVRKDYALYFGILVAFGGCAIACIVMAIAVFFVYGIKIEVLSLSLKILVAFLTFAGSCYALRYKVRSIRAAVKEMTFSLEQPECNIPNDYSEETKAARLGAAEKINHFISMIVAYGVLSVTLWAATALFVALAVIDAADFTLMLFVAVIMFVMALSLTILNIAYIIDLPEALKYKEDAERVLNEKGEPSS